MLHSRIAGLSRRAWSCQTTYRCPFSVFTAMRGNGFVRMNAPGMHSRPKLQTGAPVSSTFPTKVGPAQLRLAVPAGELPAGLQWAARIWFTPLVGVLTLY